jgi:asparagine synthase (glutamine-hydrolysing)
MCGICGVIGIERHDTAEEILRRMMAALHHRGPDDEGALHEARVALGMRRLSIIDLAGGHQPVWNETRDVAVVFNGEIYNFLELRRELESLGHRFQTLTDTEVIVHGYEQWGQDCAGRLRGMFAFAVYDRRSGLKTRVFLARDRLGIKPLYYTRRNGALFFASEVRALLASGQISAEISPGALESYLLFGSVSEPMTLVEGVQSLLPGHFLVLSPDDAARDFHPVPYWNLAEAARAAAPKSKNVRDAAPRIRSLLEEAVRSHLIADVPLGIFLSSGIDSTAIAALAARERAGIHTFTVDFEEQEFSEAALARQTAEHFGTRHQELLLRGEEMLARLGEAVAALDQPTMNGINSYFVSWAARQAGLKVALSGLGGDEVFGGYSTFRTAPAAELMAGVSRGLPRLLRSVTAGAVSRFGASNGEADARRKLAALWRDPGALPHGYYFMRALFTPEHAAQMQTNRRRPHNPEPWQAWMDGTIDATRSLDDFAAVSCFEMRGYMLNTLLRDTDAVSMSHSLEVRVPLLDHVLVEEVVGLPASAKRGAPKSLLVEAMADLLPKPVAEQKKRTFTFPWERWLRGPLRSQVETSLGRLAPALEPLLRRDALQGVWSDFLAGRTSWSRPWSLFVLNEWVRRHSGVALNEPGHPDSARVLAGRSVAT